VGFVYSLFLFSKQVFIKKYTTRQQEMSINSREKKWFIFTDMEYFLLFRCLPIEGNKYFLKKFFKKVKFLAFSTATT